MPRRSIDVEGFGHENPIPAASRVGPLLVTSVIAPFDPGTRDVPADPEAQVRNLFTHMGRILAEAGAGFGDVAKITFFVNDLAMRTVINGPWTEHFPDPASRPARHTQLAPAAGDAVVRCDVLAYVER